MHGLLLLRWRYSPWWALASSTIRLQDSRSLTLSLHSFIPIFLRSMDTSSSHLIFGLPLRLVTYSFPYIFFLGLRCLAFFLYDQAIVFFGYGSIYNQYKIVLLYRITTTRSRCRYSVRQYNFILFIDTTVRNNDNEISLHFKPMRLIFINYSV